MSKKTTKEFRNKYHSNSLQYTWNLKQCINDEIENFPTELKDVTITLLNVPEKVLSGPMNISSLTLRNALQNIIENFDNPNFLISDTFKGIKKYSDKFKLFIENDKQFNEIFNLDIWDFHDGLGFDIVKFDEKFNYDEGISMSDYIKNSYGENAHILIKQLL